MAANLRAMEAYALPLFRAGHIPVVGEWFALPLVANVSAVPLAITAAVLLASPTFAIKLARGGFGEHLLDLKSIAAIERDGFPES